MEKSREGVTCLSTYFPGLVGGVFLMWRKHSNTILITGAGRQLFSPVSSMSATPSWPLSPSLWPLLCCLLLSFGWGLCQLASLGTGIKEVSPAESPGTFSTAFDQAGGSNSGYLVIISVVMGLNLEPPASVLGKSSTIELQPALPLGMILRS